MLLQLVLVLRTCPSCWCEVQLAQASTCPMILCSRATNHKYRFKSFKPNQWAQFAVQCVQVVLDERGADVRFSWLSPFLVWLPFFSCLTTISERSE
jgi:hypothetical protein